MTLFDLAETTGPSICRVPPVTALEVDFPAVMISQVAEQESWRKEVHRPASHTHKWWAQRLGTVFRGILASAVTADAGTATEVYSSGSRLEGLVVFDPFAGSGTTLVEAAKLGAEVVGCDINPVATLVQRQALARWNRAGLDEAFCSVESTCRSGIDRLHVAATGETVLYYFWVAVANCPGCDDPVELFSDYVFARHAYARRFPAARATCPDCHAVVRVNLSSDDKVACSECGNVSDVKGPVSGQRMTCRSGHVSRVVDALGGCPPRHRLFAKLVLGFDGSKRYEPADDFDRDLYASASEQLAAQYANLVLPAGVLNDGYNTRQALRWGYEHWAQFFNDRQLLSLGMLGRAVRDLDCDPAHREAMVALFSGVLEFNNLFCSYKGEGTGAVRHMFSHHVLKPERIPLEAHPWGTPASSGSFSTLYKARVLRALEYKDKPHDIVLQADGAHRRSGISKQLGVGIARGWDAFSQSDHALVWTGSGGDTGLPDSSVDLIVTDPPFMDNVHYSELADFFHAWLRELKPFSGYPMSATTRNAKEVQNADPAAFGSAIQQVWSECARVLKPTGLLAFTFHQSKLEGWTELVRAMKSAGLVVTSVQPVKAEMSTAAPKSSAREPSNLDAIVVCRRAEGLGDIRLPVTPEAAARRGAQRLRLLRDAGVTVGPADCRSVIRGCVLSMATAPDAHHDPDDLASIATVLAEGYVAEFKPNR